MREIQGLAGYGARVPGQGRRRAGLGEARLWNWKFDRHVIGQLRVLRMAASEVSMRGRDVSLSSSILAEGFAVASDVIWMWP